MAWTVQVEIDHREKTPLLFPQHIVWCPEPFVRTVVKIETKTVELDAADYRLKNWPTACGIERKAGLDELRNNLLTDDRVRFHNAWARFISTYQFPVLLIEDSPSRNWEPRCFKTPSPGTKKTQSEDVYSALWRLLFGTPGLHVVWSGHTSSVASRRRLGAQMVRMMLHSTHFTKGDKH